MNKYMLLGLIFLYLIIVTLLAGSLNVGISGGLDAPLETEGARASVSSFLEFMGVFWRLMTFQINLPFTAVLIFFYPPLIIVIFMIADIIKDVIPFT